MYRLQPVFLENYLERLTSEAEMSPEAQAGDFHQAIDTLCAFYEAMGKFGKAARKFWNVATTDRPLALAVRISYMKKAIAIERRSTSRRGTDLKQAAAQDGDIKQAEATLWPNCLIVAELQLDAVRAISPDSDPGDGGISMGSRRGIRLPGAFAVHGERWGKFECRSRRGGRHSICNCNSIRRSRSCSRGVGEGSSSNSCPGCSG